MKSLFFTLSLTFIFSSYHAQQTGSFSLEISFEEADYTYDRTLYFFVPENYDSANQYPLVVGFRGGPHSNAGQFRDQLAFVSDSLGAIVMCPENEDHFWNDEGLTKQLFQYSVDTCSMLYSIDPDEIYLTGLSYGGRHAVIVSMDTDEGSIPQIKGVIPFAAGSEAHLQPNYEDIDQFPPACICIGLDDSQTFIDVSNNLHDDIQSNEGTSILNEIEGVGHTTAFTTFPLEFMECINFINDPGANNISNVELDFSIEIYPNPVVETLFIQVEKQIERITILDLNGRVLYSESDGSKEINLSDFPHGTLIVQVTIEGITVSRLIEKE